MNISTYIKAIMVTVLLGSAAIAQETRLSPEQVEQFLERIEETKARLNLTEEQSELIRPIMRENMQQSMAVLQKYGFERGVRPDLNFREKIALGREMKGLRDANDEKMKAILTDEQMDEYEDIRDERRAAMRERLGL